MVGESGPWYLNPSFLPAAFGLLGVVVGGVISAVSSYLLDAKRAERDRQQEERARAIEIKRAARMIDADLTFAQARAKTAVETKLYWLPDNVPLKLNGWENYRSIIAPAVTSDV